MWHNKIVTRASHPNMEKYVVTASLRESDGQIVFALMNLNYSRTNPDWTAYHIADEEFPALIATLQFVDEERYPELWQDLLANFAKEMPCR